MVKVHLGNDWDELLADEFNENYYFQLWKFLEDQYRFNTVYPEKKEDIFNALRNTSYKQTKVVIVGQDPYFNPSEANGLAFSVAKCCDKIPRSLKNIFEAICEDNKKYFVPDNGDLLPWTRQGVLLLNTVLTVVHGIPYSHGNIPSQAKGGWKRFTKRILKILNDKPKPVVFLLWRRQVPPARASICKTTMY